MVLLYIARVHVLYIFQIPVIVYIYQHICWVFFVCFIICLLGNACDPVNIVQQFFMRLLYICNTITVQCCMLLLQVVQRALYPALTPPPSTNGSYSSSVRSPSSTGWYVILLRYIHVIRVLRDFNVTLQMIILRVFFL